MKKRGVRPNQIIDLHFFRAIEKELESSKTHTQRPVVAGFIPAQNRGAQH